MKLVSNVIAALALSLASGGAALAADGDDRQHHRHDGDRWDRDDDRGRWNDGDRRNDGDRWNRPGGWRHSVPVRFVNERDQPVTLYLNGRYLGRLAPSSRERIAVPAGYHTVTYQVGWRNQRWHQINVSAVHGQRNRVVIEGRRWRGGRGW